MLNEIKSTVVRKLSAAGSSIISGGNSVHSLTTENLSLGSGEQDPDGLSGTGGLGDEASHHSKSSRGSYGETGFGEAGEMNEPDPIGMQLSTTNMSLMSSLSGITTTTTASSVRGRPRGGRGSHGRTDDDGSNSPPSSPKTPSKGGIMNRIRTFSFKKGERNEKLIGDECPVDVVDSESSGRQSVSSSQKRQMLLNNILNPAEQQMNTGGGFQSGERDNNIGSGGFVAGSIFGNEYSDNAVDQNNGTGSQERKRSGSRSPLGSYVRTMAPTRRSRERSGASVRSTASARSSVRSTGSNNSYNSAGSGGSGGSDSGGGGSGSRESNHNSRVNSQTSSPMPGSASSGIKKIFSRSPATPKSAHSRNTHSSHSIGSADNTSFGSTVSSGDQVGYYLTPAELQAELLAKRAEEDASEIDYSFWIDSSELVFDLNEDNEKRIIGRGSYGSIYLASWNGTPCAVKRIFEDKVGNLLLQKFQGEIKLMTRLRHPNIIQTYGACWPKSDPKGGRDGGFGRCIIMEYAQLGSLNSLLLDKGELLPWVPMASDLPTEDEVQRHNKLQFTVQVARGMVYLHSQKSPIMHRDLKSSNVLVAQGYQMKLCDFGDSKSHENHGERGSDSETGTLLFMAPEIVTASSYNISVDVYSFAILLIEMLTNGRLKEFYNFPAARVMHKVTSTGWRPDLTQYEGDIETKAITDIIQRCWVQEPDDRPTFKEVLTHLTNLMGKKRDYVGISGTFTKLPVI